MNHRHAIVRRRRVVLIGSGSGAFIEILSEMVAECGFEIATAAAAEPSWLAVTRTQPALVICDCSGPEQHARALLVEAVARGLPLLLIAASHEEVTVRPWPFLERIACLEFPIARERFGMVLDALTMPRQTVTERNLIPSAVGRRIEVTTTTQTVDVALSGPRVSITRAYTRPLCR